MKVQIFTDGACSGNPGPGGWAFVILIDGELSGWLNGGEEYTTNNKMELTAVIQALYHVPQEASSIEVVTDSKYVQNGMNSWLSGWKKNNWKTSRGGDIKNKELWEELSKVCERLNITFTWVKGHDGHPENERVDTLAREAVEAMKK